MRVLLVAVAMLLAASPASTELVDRVLATVSGRTITLSDVRMAARFGLAGSAPTASDETVLEQLINRVLVLEEVDRYAPPEPEAAAIRRALDAARGRFPSPEAFAAALRTSGIDELVLEQWMRNDLRIEQYLQQRFAGGFDPTDEDLEGYARAHRAELEAGGRSLDDPDVLRLVRERTMAERRAAVVNEWIEGLRSRAEINRPPAPPA